MRRAIVLVILGVVAGAAAAGDGPKLVNKKLILADDGKTEVVKRMHSARLSPDGRHLLYMRVKRVQLPAPPGQPAWQRRFYHLILRDVRTGKDKSLPTPPYGGGEIAAAGVSGRIFGLGGKAIALWIGDDANGDGLHDYGAEKMQPVVYDIASGKLTKLPITEEGVLATFDRTGKGLIIMSMSRSEGEGKLLTTPLDKPKLRQLGKWGMPRGVCPTADVLPLLLPAERGADRRFKFILYDLKADKQITELPTHEKNRMLDDYCPQWTADGRYLYYVDVRDETDQNGVVRRKVLTRIWDRTKGREAGTVGDLIPIGPGPGKTTMVVAKGHRASKQMFLHDAATSASHSLGKETMNAIAGEGKYLLYADKPADGKSGMYMAEIVLPKKDKPAKKPPGKKEPKPKPRAVK